MEELEKSEKLDLNSCGIAVYSAATIHRMKTERLLKSDVPSISNKQVFDESFIVPPPMDLPYMPEFMVTTLGDLVQALRNLFLRMEARKNTSRGEAFLEIFDVKIDEFLVKIEEKLEEFIQGLRNIFGNEESIDVSRLFEGVSRLDAARRFILLLFAAAKGIVELVEDEGCRLIAIRLVNVQSSRHSRG